MSANLLSFSFRNKMVRGGDAFDLTTGVWTWPLIMDPITEDRKWKGKKGMGFTVNDLNFL